MSDINFALVEDTRPPIYTAMKYWGKKPHNIWREYIENYTPKDGIFLDPFAGSTISAFKAVKVNRKTITFDLNPLTSFIIEVFSTKFDKKEFEKEVQKILDEVQKDKTYLKYYSTVSRKTGANAVAQSFKWEDGEIYELGINYTKEEILEETNGRPSKRKFRYVAEPNDNDQKLARKQSEIKIDNWFPDEPFINSPSFNANFIQAVGGNNFSNLWTRRNLYVLSKIFDLIKKNKNENIKTQLLFGFIQSLHLTTNNY